jgi:hypothetical protein
MTAPTSTLPVVPLTETVRASADETACNACPHPSADHDKIAQRFCDATLTGAMDRGCICRS